MKLFVLAVWIAAVAQLTPIAHAQTTPTGSAKVTCTGNRAGKPMNPTGGTCYNACRPKESRAPAADDEKKSSGPADVPKTAGNGNDGPEVNPPRPSNDGQSNEPAGGGTVDPHSGSFATTVILPSPAFGTRPICGYQAVPDWGSAVYLGGPGPTQFPNRWGPQGYEVLGKKPDT